MPAKQITVVVAVIKNQQNQVYIQQHTPRHANLDLNEKWELPGGKIEFGEDPEQAIMREVKEETNYAIKVLRTLKIETNLFLEIETQVILIPYECRLVSGDYTPEPGKVTEGKFCTLEEIRELDFLPKDQQIIFSSFDKVPDYNFQLN
jgi:8-oxo-dGTP diphosphatase